MIRIIAYVDSKTEREKERLRPPDIAAGQKPWNHEIDLFRQLFDFFFFPFSLASSVPSPRRRGKGKNTEG